MSNRKIGNITLAITLITIGLLFLLKNFIVIDVREIILVTWPVVIIFLGLEIIFVNILSRKKGETSSVKIDGLSITLIILIIIASNIFSGLNIAINDINFISEITRNYKYDSKFNRNMTIDVQNKNKIIINNAFGDIEIRGEDVEKVVVDMEVLIKHNDENYAKFVLDNIVEINENSEDIIELTTIRNRFLDNRTKIKSINVNYKIKIPKNLDVEVNNGYGNIMAKNISKSVILDNRHGDILAQSIGGNLILENLYGDVNVEKVEGKVKVNNQHGDVKVSEAGGPLTVKNPHGEVEIQNVMGNVDILNNHEDIMVSSVEGNLYIYSEFSEIGVSNIKGNVKVESEHSSLNIGNINGSVDVKNDFGDVNLKNIDKSINVINQHDDIIFQSDNIIENDITIENQYGNISLTLPSNQEGMFEIIANYGSIRDEFGMNIRKEVNRQSILQSLGTNTVKFYLKTKNGDITIEGR